MKLKKGFTLIELLVTLTVIAIITTLTIVVINNVNNLSKEVVVKVNKESLIKAAITYVQEFKMNEVWDKQNTDEYVCISVNQLKNKGYFSGKLIDENGDSIDGTTLKITRDSNKVIQNEIERNSVDCISVPTVELLIDGATTNYNSKEWYYDKDDASITLILNREIGYFPIRITYKGVVISEDKFTKISGTDYVYKLNLSDINNIENYGGEIEIKVSVGLAGNKVADAKTIYADFKTPTKPILTPSDNILTGNWHDSRFVLNISSETSPSGNYYKYGYSSSNINTVVKNKIDNIDNSVARTIYVITCNNVGKCNERDVEEYRIITKPAVTLTLEGPTKKYNSKEWYYDSTNTKIKLTITSERSDFSKILKVGNETVTLSNVTPSNNTYIYSVKLGDINNIKKYGENTNISASITLNGKTIPISKTINLDLTTPNKPTLIASDELPTGKWHSNSFDLNISSEGTSPSGNYYIYGYDKSTINTKVDGTSVPVSENGSFTIYVKKCNNVGTCSSYSEYKTIKSVTLVSGRLELSFGQYFDDSVISFKDVKFEEGDTKVSKIYYLINTNYYSPKTLQEFIDANPTNSTKHIGEIKSSKVYSGRIAVVDTAGNVQMYRIGKASPGGASDLQTTKNEYNYWAEYGENNSNNYAWVGVYDDVSGKMLTTKNYKFENKRLEFTILSTGALEWRTGFIKEPGIISLGTLSGCMNSNLSSSWTCPHGGSPKKINGKWMCTVDEVNSGFSYCYDKYGNKLENCSDAQSPWEMPGFKNIHIFYPKFSNVGCKCTTSTIGKKPTEFIYEQGGCPLYADEVPNFSSGPYPGGPYPHNENNPCPICKSVGVFPANDDLLQVSFCKWNNYDAVCKSPTYSCPSGTVYQVEDYCYSCKTGGTNVEGTGYCEYTGVISYKYKIYTGYYSNEIEKYYSIYGG